jgi:hypothetical protein
MAVPTANHDSAHSAPLQSWRSSVRSDYAFKRSAGEVLSTPTPARRQREPGVSNQMEATDHKAITEHLRSLGTREATSDSRIELLGALASKHDGIRVVAAQSLCQWGDQASIVAVKESLWTLATKPSRFSAVGAICHALGPRLDSSDLDWVMSLFCEQSHNDNCGTVGFLLCEFPAASVCARLELVPIQGRDGPFRRALSVAKSFAQERRRTEG